MAFLTSASRLLASAVLLCAAAAAPAAETEKTTLDQIKQALDELKQQQQTPYSKYTVNPGSLAIESWLLTATAIDASADRIKAAIPTIAAGRKILVVAATEPVDFGQVPMMELEIRALNDRLGRTCKCHHARAAAAPIALAGELVGLLKSETELTGLEQNVDAKVLAAAVARRLTKGQLPSAAVAGGEGGQLIDDFNVLANTADDAQAEVDRLANLKKPTATDKDKLERLKVLLGRYDAFYTRVTTLNQSGVVPLAAAARLEELMKDDPYVLRVNTEKAGGTLLKRTNLWTALGTESAFVSGGLVSSYQLTEPSDGKVIAAGIVTCRTTLTSLKNVQEGSWSSAANSKARKSEPVAVCLP